MFPSTISSTSLLICGCGGDVALTVLFLNTNIRLALDNSVSNSNTGMYEFTSMVSAILYFSLSSKVKSIGF